MLSKSTDYTPGNVYDSNFFTSLLADDEAAACADNAYASAKHVKWLKEHKVKSERTKTSHCRRKANSLTWLHSGTRCTVERVFRVPKLH